MKAASKYEVIILFFFALCLENGEAAAPKNQSLCGPLSLQIICKNQGVSTTLKELCHLTKYNEKTGTTMLGLYQAAHEKKIPVTPVRVKIDDLCRMKDSSIAFVDGNHFLVVCGCEKENVLLEDPLKGRYKQSKKIFQTRWKGEILLFGKSATRVLVDQPTAPLRTIKEGPRIQFDATSYSSGIVSENSVLSHTFNFTNTGSDTLKVTVRSNCSCTAALLSEKNIPPGGSGKIRLKFKTEGRIGVTKQGVSVRTNDTDNPLLTLTMTATIKRALKVVPDRLWLGEISGGEQIIREVLVIDSGDGSLKVEGIKSPEGITSEILLTRKDASGLRVCPIRLTIKSGNASGKFEKVASIKTNDSRTKEIPLKISGTVLTDVKAFPPRIFFGEVKPNSTAIREVVVSVTNGEKIVVVQARSASPSVSVEVVPSEGGSKYRIIATLNAPHHGTTVRDSVVVYLKDQTTSVLDIPLYAKVADAKN